jgi:hypothetical protein
MNAFRHRVRAGDAIADRRPPVADPPLAHSAAIPGVPGVSRASVASSDLLPKPSAPPSRRGAQPCAHHLSPQSPASPNNPFRRAWQCPTAVPVPTHRVSFSPETVPVPQAPGREAWGTTARPPTASLSGMAMPDGRCRSPRTGSRSRQRPRLCRRHPGGRLGGRRRVPQRHPRRA